ncbi:HD domain-containing phosphohydrolase [Neomoorella mulderi]|uniref:Cyclic di-GMP phosphodiesterase response regulator RpfG n=1 Tax=Moorella mulderi DSM 14980 TaxID=1122241 RepID=A0A151B1Q6_9FIRM|nr:HD domain-containing phosphohydrolase [Moorella mulderi]KYH33828.1 cyclic di-GMP phosphodiesterase response regulator RpfG [Moorella mulderi DSM 14980]
MQGDTVGKILLEIKQFWPALYFHSIAVANIACRMAFDLGIDASHYQDLLIGALLHDAGKMQVRREILTKPGPLTEAEWRQIKKHTDYGADWVEQRGGNDEVVAVIRYHHEWWNGNGYAGLKYEQIPLLARIVTIADALDAMTASRPYRKTIAISEALLEVHTGKGLQFDPNIITSLSQKATYEPATYQDPRTLARQIQVEKEWLARLIKIYGDLAHPLVIAQSHWLDKLIVTIYKLQEGKRGKNLSLWEKENH